MTVCIAAIAEQFTVLGASDRLLTTGDLRFEPEIPKISHITNSIVAMTAGDANFIRECVDDLRRAVTQQINAQPDEWLDLRWTAETFAALWARAKLKRAELALLAPLGLNTDSFITSQAAMAPSLVERIADSLVSYKVPSTECIIAGVDPSGAHLYSIIDGYVACHDSVGFVAIGSGGRHASSQLMLAGYSPNLSLGEAMVLLHASKRRAEVAPSVGEATDMIISGPGPGTLFAVGDHVLTVLDSQFDTMTAAEREAMAKAKTEMVHFVGEMRLAAAASASQAEGQTSLAREADEEVG